MRRTHWKHSWKHEREASALSTNLQFARWRVVDFLVDRGSAPLYSLNIKANLKLPDLPPAAEAEIDLVFSETRPLIQMALVHYRVGNREASAIERDLRLWFRRLVERVNNSRTPATAFRKYLLQATCEFAYAYQARNPEARARDRRLREVLARSPRIVAAELQRMLE